MLSVGSSVLAWRWLITIESVLWLYTCFYRVGHHWSVVWRSEHLGVLPDMLRFPRRSDVHVSSPASPLLNMSSYLILTSLAAASM